MNPIEPIIIGFSAGLAAMIVIKLYKTVIELTRR